MKQSRWGWILILLGFFLHGCKKTEKVYSFFSVDRSEITVSSVAGRDYLQITTGGEWSISGLPDWVIAQPASGKGDAKVELTYPANDTNVPRVTNFEVKSTEPSFVPIKVKFTQVEGDLSIVSFTEHARGGEDVIINGFGFSDTKDQNVVTINGKPATVLQASLTALTIKVPLSAGDGFIVVGIGDKKKTSAQRFVYDWVWKVATIAGSGDVADLDRPHGIAVTGDGDVYVADTYNQRILKIEEQPGGTYEVNRFAGAYKVSGSADGRDLARFNWPADVAIDQNGILYVPDENSRIRKITNDGTVSKVLNNLYQQVDMLSSRVAAYGAGNLIVCDLNNNSLRKISNEGIITTIADNSGNFPSFNRLEGVVCSRDGKIIYVCDYFNNRIQKINVNADGTSTRSIIAGSLTGLAGKVNGKGTVATFNKPTDIAMDDQGVLYVSDNDNHLIRKIVVNQDGTADVSTIAGTGSYGYKDGIGIMAEFDDPIGIAVNKKGDAIYVADSGNNRIRKLTLQ